MYAAGKTAHQMDADIANLCLIKRSGNGRRRDLGRIEWAAVILDPGDQRSVLALDFDCNLQAPPFATLYMIILVIPPLRDNQDSNSEATGVLSKSSLFAGPFPFWHPPRRSCGSFGLDRLDGSGTSRPRLQTRV